MENTIRASTNVETRHAKLRDKDLNFNHHIEIFITTICKSINKFAFHIKETTEVVGGIQIMREMTAKKDQYRREIAQM